MIHKERILKVMRGEMADVIPFVPRLDLWWLANASRGTLPQEFAAMGPDDISRAEGWPVYHMVPAFADVSSADDILHRAIGLFNFKQSVYGWRFSSNIEVRTRDEQGQQLVEYHTPLGMVRTAGGLTDAMKRAGASLGWVQEHVIKGPVDYRIVGYLFENIEVFPQYEGARHYMAMVGDDGVAAAGGPTLAASPMHMIQKDLIDTTQFYYAYKDHQIPMRKLADSIEVYFNKVLDIIAHSPAEVVLWGANYDDMITYPPYFAKEILPWLRKASQTLGSRGKLVATHTDGENQGLLDLIRESGVHIAESVTPYPMTKVRIEEYYRRWHDHLTIMGGIPESLLMKTSTSDEDFEAFLDHFFNTIIPGDRIILGTADSTPPDADFDRLRRIAERAAMEGRLPLHLSGKTRTDRVKTPSQRSMAHPVKHDERLLQIQQTLMDGDEGTLKTRVLNLLEDSIPARDVLSHGLILGMQRLSKQFMNGEIFIPEVLFAARAMNGVFPILEPYLTETDRVARHRVLIGTVQGDMHDIGKNIVAIMLKGAGFVVHDLGINVATEEFLRQVEKRKPDILALSALLTTTMPEMKNIIDGLTSKGLRKKVKVMVGGAPVNRKFAVDIGADAYGGDAGTAVDVTKSLLGIK